LHRDLSISILANIRNPSFPSIDSISISRGTEGAESNRTAKKIASKKVLHKNIDALAKTRHTRGLCAVALAKEQSGYPGFV
jgi:hypothetical protein